MSGIKIEKALYGAGSQTVDVTSAITGNLKDGNVNLVVTAESLNVADPAPGQPKQLTVSYTINGGKTNTETVLENGVLTISAPPMRSADGLSIIKAEYGYDGNFTDVTNAVQTLVDNGSIKLKVSPSAVGVPDPNPSKKKKLKVEYTLNGATNSDEFADGQVFQLSAPAQDKVDTTKPSSYVRQLIGVLFSNLYWFAMAFLYTVSTFATADFFGAAPVFTPKPIKAEDRFNELTDAFKTPEGRSRMGYLLVGAVLPGFAYWGLPVYVFWRRIFSNSYML
jgi:hypothetical protein